MKKIFTLIIAVVMLCFCSVTALADAETFSTAGDLFQHWEQTQYPNYICGVWSTDGGAENLTFGIQNTEEGRDGKQYILSLLEDDSTVTFVYRKYSRNYLVGIMEEIYYGFKKSRNEVSYSVTGMSVDEINNCLTVSVLEDQKNEAKVLDFVSKIIDEYGDAIAVEYVVKDDLHCADGDELTIGVNELVDKDIGTDIISYTEDDQSFLAYIVGAITIALLLGLIFITGRQKRFVLKTNTGKTVAAPCVVTTKEIETMVRNSNTSPSADLDNKIISTIGNIHT